MRIGSLFTGYGGLDLGTLAAIPGTSVAWHAEIDKHAAAILQHHWPDIPNHGDITAIDWATVEPVNILTGGFPCQDVSAAGKRAGIKAGTRSGLWAIMAEAVEHLQPDLVIIENVRGLLSAEASSDVEPCPHCMGDDSGGPVLRALGAVLGDLADIGYDATWGTFRASDVGACHRRERVFIVAYPANADSFRLEHSCDTVAGEVGLHAITGHSSIAADTGRKGLQGSPHRDGTTPTRRQRQLEPSTSTPARDSGTSTDADRKWGPYADAIHRWERVLGRPAPPPTEPGTNNQPRLSPVFVEWMMGLPHGHVTHTGIPRTQQLKALGNGVVPQQAQHAIETLTREA